jgi:hypothetical protein
MGFFANLGPSVFTNAMLGLIVFCASDAHSREADSPARPT